MSRYAELTVAEIAALRAAGRRRLLAVPTPLVAFGLVNLGGVLATVLVGRYHLALYGLPAFAVAIMISARAFARRARSEGVQVAVRPWALTAAALCIAGVGASRAGDLLGVDPLSAIGPFLGEAIALALLARWADSDVLLATAILMALASVLIGSLASGDSAVAIQFAVYGTLLLAAAGYVTLQSRAQ